MPTASVARLEKQASLDANDPLRQAIVMIDHKIRNLEKRKGRLDGYRDLQKNGKDLNSDQLDAISKYDAVVAHLDFTKELSKLLTNLAIDSAKNSKKQARKEAMERAQQELARTKDILIIQDVLASMGQDAVRDDFLNGKAKVTLTAEELQAIDDLYVELTPKRDEPMVFTDMFQSVAETMVTLVDGKNKEAFGTTYSALKSKLLEVANSGYFDTAPPPPAAPEQAPTQQEDVPPPLPPPPPITNEEPQITEQPEMNSQEKVQTLPTCTFQPAPINLEDTTQAPIETTYFTPSHLRVFKSGTIDFMQDNELDIPESNDPPSIPTMTYTNQSFSPLEMASQHVAAVPSAAPPPQAPPQSVPPQAVPTPATPTSHHYQNQTDEEKGWSTNTLAGGEPQPSVIVTSSAQVQQPNAIQQAADDLSGWEDEQQTQAPQDESDWASQTENWSDNIYKPQNDGFITAGSGRGRGGRGRGGGNDRNKGGYNNRGGNRGGSRGGYNRSGEGGGGYYSNREGGGNYRDGGYREGGNNYYKDQGSYQNGYQNRGDQQRGGGRGGGPNNRTSSDRAGNRGGRGGRGSYRGNNSNPANAGGGYRQ